MKALDLFCCAGGAGMGLHQAGFEVTGVDMKAQKRYPFTFLRGDVLKINVERARQFDLIWASPPCQHHTAMKTMPDAREHPDLIPQTRELLNKIGKPYIIENVVGARKALINPIQLCGTSFGLGVEDADLQRHRLFETSFPVEPISCNHGARATIGVYGGHMRNRKRRTIGVYGEGCRDSRRKLDRGVADFTIEQGREAMGIGWMSVAELCEAIPPAYSKYLAEQFLLTVKNSVAA